MIIEVTHNVLVFLICSDTPIHLVAVLTITGTLGDPIVDIDYVTPGTRPQSPPPPPSPSIQSAFPTLFSALRQSNLSDRFASIRQGAGSEDRSDSEERESGRSEDVADSDRH